MGELSGGGAPRAKTIVEKLTSLDTSATEILDATNDVRDAVSEAQSDVVDAVGAVETAVVGLKDETTGHVPVNLAEITPGVLATGAGPAAGEEGEGEDAVAAIRVIVADDDPNLSALVSQLDITLSALRDALRGTGEKNFTTLESALALEAGGNLEAVKTAVESVDETLGLYLDVSQSGMLEEFQDAAYALQNAIGDLQDAVCGADEKDLSTIQATIDQIKTAVNAIETASEGSDAALDVLLSTRASEETLSDVSETLTDVKTAVSAIQTTSVTLATNATLTDVKTAVESVGTTLSSASATLSTVSTNLDTALDTPQSELLAAIQDVPDTLAKETTLASVNTAIGGLALESGGNLAAVRTAAESASTTLTSKLDITQSALQTGVVNGIRGANGKDLSTLQTATDAIKIASETSATVLGTISTAVGGLAGELTGELALESGGNLESVKDAVESIDDTLGAQLDIKQSELRDAIRGASTKDFSTLQAAVDNIKTTSESLAKETTLANVKTAVDLRALESGGNLEAAKNAAVSANTTLGTQLNIKQSDLRDAICGTGDDASNLGALQASVDEIQTTTGEIQAAVDDIKTASQSSATSLGNFDALLSTRASEATLSAVSTAIGNLALEADGNLEAVKTAVESIDTTISSQLDISQSDLRDELITAICGADTKDFSTLQTATDAIKIASETSATSLGNLDVLLSSRASESTLSAINTAVGGLALESGGNLATISSKLNISQSELRDDIVDAINASRPTPVVTAGTGDEAISVSYAPGKSFWLDAVTVHFSAAPTTAGDLTVTLDAGDGAAYDTVLFRVDPSVDGGATDIVFTPMVPILCVEGDAIVVAYANTDGVTYGTRIVAREI